MAIMWTEKEIEYLKKNYHNTESELLVLYLNKKRPTITSKANLLGLKKNKEVTTKTLKKINPGTFFSKEEDDFLKKNFDTLSYVEMARELKKTRKSIQKRIKKIGLKKTKKGISSIKTKNNKKRGRDLNLKNLKKIALKYKTKKEFYFEDPVAYSTAVKNNLLEKICSHMVTIQFSIPQLIMKDILEFILKEKCSYNDKKQIKPLEIDCYFEKYKIGWEYDGRYFHEKINHGKIIKCNKKGIKLFIVDEKGKLYKKYEQNIKKQIISQLKEINKITGLNIKKEDIIKYEPKIVYPNLLTIEEKKYVKNKKISEIKSEKPELFKKIKKYKLFLNKDLKIIYDLKSNKIIKSYEEYIDFIKNSKIKSFHELTKKEHPYRIAKKLNFSVELIKNYFKKSNF